MPSDSLRQAAATPVAAGKPTRSLSVLVEQQKDEIARALGNSPELADSMVRTVLTELRRNPTLAQCTPGSFLGAVMVCAHLGLEPGPMKLASLVPFKNHNIYECQIIVQYRGYIELAMRSGLLESIEARTVRANDHFIFKYGLHPELEHWYKLGDDRGAIVGFYCVAKLKTGGENFIVLSKDEVDNYRRRSRAKDSGPWVTDYEAMGQKTAVRRMEPFLPKSTKMGLGFASDEHTVIHSGNDLLIQDEPERGIADADNTDADIPDAEVVAQPAEASPEPPNRPRRASAATKGSTEPQESQEAAVGTEPDGIATPNQEQFADGGADGDPDEPLVNPTTGEIEGGEPF